MHTQINSLYYQEGKGAFISPATVPDELLSYYDSLGLDVASRENIIDVGSSSTESSVIQRLTANHAGQELLASRQGSFVVPYMVTNEVEMFASAQGMDVLAPAHAVSHMGDKAYFQQELARIKDDICEKTGFDIAIQTAPEFQAGDKQSAEEAYEELSQNGRRDVMVIKPKSASALGVFVAHAVSGEKGLHTIIDERFQEGERVLLEERVEHNHSPSMQGTHTLGGSYQHLYFGTQFLSSKGTTEIQYDGDEIPFGATTVAVQPEELVRAEQLHKLLGELIMKRHGIHGIAGFDSVMNIADDGRIESIKFTELNLHLPGSSAVYAAAAKVFPAGFKGIARNWRLPLKNGETTENFFERNHKLLVPEQQTYGLFPINMSYSDKVDMIAFAPNEAKLTHLIERTQTP